MAAQLLDEITWDGQALLVAAATDNSQVTCRVPGRTIPALRFYSDIIGRAIELARQKEDRREARPLTLSRTTAGETPDLLPSEVRD
jgi:hypothetical protein